jgi:hypothetical protein
VSIYVTPESAMLLGFRAVPAAKLTYHNKIEASTARACRARKKVLCDLYVLGVVYFSLFDVKKNHMASLF